MEFTIMYFTLSWGNFSLQVMVGYHSIKKHFWSPHCTSIMAALLFRHFRCSEPTNFQNPLLLYSSVHCTFCLQVPPHLSKLYLMPGMVLGASWSVLKLYNPAKISSFPGNILRNCYPIFLYFYNILFLHHL